MRDTILVKSCNQNKLVVANARILRGVEIYHLLAIRQVHICNWNVNSIYEFVDLVTLRSTEIASRAIAILISVLQAYSIYKHLE